MKKITTAIVLALLCLNFFATAQVKKGIGPLSIGDMVPDVSLGTIINYSKPTAQLSDFKGKLLILDFWATWCAPCVNNFPKIYSLQKEFKEKVQFLPVNSMSSRDSRRKIERFFIEHYAVYQLPCVVADTALTILFPHKTIPHYVWIKDNQVKAITTEEEINKKNIASVVNDDYNLTVVSKKEIGYDPKLPLFVDGNGGEPKKYIFRSLLAPYADGLASTNGLNYQDDGKITRLSQINTSILFLYQTAYPLYGDYSKNRIIFKVKNPTDYSLDSTALSWKSRNLYNYELSFPPLEKSEALKLMRGDLDRYFGLSVRLEKRTVDVLVLKGQGNNIANRHSGGTPQTNIYEKGIQPKYFRYYSLDILSSYLNDILESPFVDESGYVGIVDLKLPADLNDETALMISFNQQGFILAKEKREMIFLVFTDPKLSVPLANP